MAREPAGNRAPPPQGGKQTIDGRLENRRAIAQLRRFPDRLVNYRVERDDATEQFSPHRPCIRYMGSSRRQRGGEPGGNLRCDGGELGGEPASGATEIGAGENDAGADDASADFGGARKRQHECIAVRTADCAELVAGDNRRRQPGEDRAIGRKIVQQRGGKRAGRPP